MAMSNRNKRLMWRNKWSGETGYVKSIQATKGYFENTFDVNEARKYKSENECLAAIETLSAIGECENNEFEIVTV